MLPECPAQLSLPQPAWELGEETKQYRKGWNELGVDTYWVDWIGDVYEEQKSSQALSSHLIYVLKISPRNETVEECNANEL
jgi:hypothetical protein